MSRPGLRSSGPTTGHTVVAAVLDVRVEAAGVEHPAELAQLVRIVVDKVIGEVARVDIMPATRPFFTDVAAAPGHEDASVWRPRRDAKAN